MDCSYTTLFLINHNELKINTTHLDLRLFCIAGMLLLFARYIEELHGGLFGFVYSDKMVAVGTSKNMFKQFIAQWGASSVYQQDMD